MKLFLFLLILVSLIFPSSIYASDYVLPYPPVMPGGTMYKIRLLTEEVKRIWSFGSLSQFKYNLEQSDKYLVQTKVLVEYKQYLLGYESLQKSNQFFEKSRYFVNEAKLERKDISAQEKTLHTAAEKHSEVLNKLKNEVPSEFNWTPEKSLATQLRIHELIDTSINIRKTTK